MRTAITLAASACSLICAAALAAPGPAPSGVVRIWEKGTWSSFGSEFLFSGFKDEDQYDDPKVEAPKALPLTPEFAKKWQAIRQEAFNGRNVLDAGNRCVPLGIPFTATFGKIQILFAADRVVMTGTSDNAVRIIYTDGRPHQADADPAYNGDSIGHWEGRTLVIDTVNFKDSSYIEVGLPHSDAMHVIEHWQFVDDQTIDVKVTIEDPKALTRPLQASGTWRHEATGRLAEDICENNRDLSVNGATTMIGADGKPLTPPAQGKAKYKIIQESK